MERFADNEEFYISYLPLVAGERAFDRLKDALDSNDGVKAFESAHLLKGLIGNMGLTPMYKECCEVVESLRDGSVTRDSSKHAARLLAQLEHFRKLLKDSGIS